MYYFISEIKILNAFQVIFYHHKSNINHSRFINQSPLLNEAKLN